MKDLRLKEQKKEVNKTKLKLRLLIFWKRRKWWILSSILLGIIIFYPEMSGQAIGQWIHDFVGNLVKYSKF
jgi:hypothetical protein